MKSVSGPRAGRRKRASPSAYERVSTPIRPFCARFINIEDITRARSSWALPDKVPAEATGRSREPIR